MQRAAAQIEPRPGSRPKSHSSASKTGSAEHHRSPSTPRRGGWRPASLRVSPTRSPGASVEVRYWDERRKVQVRVVLRRFELACLGVVVLAVILALWGHRLGIGETKLLLQLFALLGGA